MEKFFVAALTATLTATFVSLIIAWVNSGSSNLRLFAFGLMSCLLALSIVVFDLCRYGYSEKDYSTKQIIVEECRKDESNNGVIISSDDSAYKFRDSLFRKIGLPNELAERLCAQKSIKVWLNEDNEISGVDNENLQIPLQAGIDADNSRHNFLSLVFIFAPLGLFLMLMAIYLNRKGVRIDPKTYRLIKIQKGKIDINQY